MKQLEELVLAFTDVLPDYKSVRSELVYFTGRELRLTGVKDYKGEPLQNDAAYGIEIPVLQPMNHKKNLRAAWLKGGLQGIYNYLEPYLGQDQLKRVKDFMMRANG